MIMESEHGSDPMQTQHKYLGVKKHHCASSLQLSTQGLTSPKWLFLQESYHL